MGWFSSNKSKTKTLITPNNWTDIHCHVLPGIDDGSPDIRTSIELVKTLNSFGCNNIIATPHIIGDMYRNNAESIGNAATLLKKALIEEKIEVNLNYAAEYMLDDYFMQLLRNESPLLTYKDQYLLTEFSYAIAPSHIEETVFEIVTRGYKPILAHPERYIYFHNNLDKYNELKDLGFYFQINMLSLSGYYGKSIEKVAHHLIKNDMIDFAGTDTHHERHLFSLPNSFYDSSINSKLESNNQLLIIK